MISDGGFFTEQTVASFVRSQQSSRDKMGSSASSEPCSRASSNSFNSRGTPGSTYHDPNPTRPKAVPEKDDETEIVKESRIYLKGVHRFVHHETCSGRTIRTEKDGSGNVSWNYEPWKGECKLAELYRGTSYPFGLGPTIGELKRRSQKHHGNYHIFYNNCGDYAEDQVSGWRVGWQWIRRVTVRCA